MGPFELVDCGLDVTEHSGISALHAGRKVSAESVDQEIGDGGPARAQDWARRLAIILALTERAFSCKKWWFRVSNRRQRVPGKLSGARIPHANF